MTHGDTARIREFTVVAVLARAEAKVLLVAQASAQGGMTWSLPAGRVEPFEDAYSAAAREVEEETGMALERLTTLAYVTHVNRSTSRDRTVALVFEGDVSGEIATNDPDGDVVAAEFVAATEAVERLRSLPSPAMREPAIAYLQGNAQPGAFWSYSDTGGSLVVPGQT